jgi:hypothetical protein
MLIRGRWTLCDDDIVRPVIEGELLASDGSWLPVELLVDVGADRTVCTAGVLARTGMRITDRTGPGRGISFRRLRPECYNENHENSSFASHDRSSHLGTRDPSERRTYAGGRTRDSAT